MYRDRFDELRERLLHAGIAPRHVRRYVAELRDHFDDLVREETENGLTRGAAEETARARIGSDDELRAVLLAQPGLRSVTARFPWLTFGVGPMLMLAVVIAAAVLIEGGLVQLHLTFVREPGGMHPLPPDWLRASTAAWNWLVMYAAPLGIAAVLCVLGIRQRVPVFWITLGAATVCVLGGFHEVSLRWADLPGRSELSASLALAPPFPRHMIIAGLFRAAVNISLVSAGYWLWLRRTRDEVAQ